MSKIKKICRAWLDFFLAGVFLSIGIFLFCFVLGSALYILGSLISFPGEPLSFIKMLNVFMGVYRDVFGLSVGIAFVVAWLYYPPYATWKEPPQESSEMDIP